jgi:MFS family permease
LLRAARTRQFRPIEDELLREVKPGALPWRLVPALGIAQIISWGALYYSITVLGAAIGADLALSPTGVFGAFSVGLLLSGLSAPHAGRAIDRYGGRRVLAVGSLVAACALFWLSRVQSPAAYYVAWCVAGVAMAMTLYDAAFATLSQHFGGSYRTALTALTLFGGFASTVFWPLSQVGLVHLGWRDTLAFFALLQVVLCLPLHWFLIPNPQRHTQSSLPSAAEAHRSVGRKRAGGGRFVALASAFALNAFVFSALSAHMILLLRGIGMTANEAV